MGNNMKGKMKCMAVLTALVVILSFSGALMAADFPNKPITMLVGFRAGGNVDTLARLIAKNMEKQFGSPVVVSPKPGAGGAIMATQLMKAAPDGYTIGMAVTPTFAFNPVFAKNPKYKTEDFVYLGSVAKGQEALVTSVGKPYKTLKDLFDHAKAGNSISFASLSPVSRLLAQFLGKEEGIQIKIVTMKGGAGTIQAVLGGHVDFGFSGGIHLAHLKAGKVRVLAATGDGRLAPPSQDIPTLKEMGYDFSLWSIFLIAGPKALPVDIKKKISDAIKMAANDPDVVKLIKNRNLPLFSVSPEELDREVFSAAENWKKVKKTLK